ncbi:MULTISPECIES: hypothetical protein [unclassified Streptomyces]|uniref:hypothetical protein n=1 Tax=unclassified Streptomyces TaxID=2593676 RepID=UPI0036E91353
MIEITIRVKPACAARLAALLRTTADLETDRGQAKAYRGAARSIERITRTGRRPAHTRPHTVAAPTPIRYTPRVQRPRHGGIDEAAVTRVVLGLRPMPVLSRDEARLACWYLTQHEAPAGEIADRVRVAKRTVHRWRAEDRQGVTV